MTFLQDVLVAQGSSLPTLPARHLVKPLTRSWSNESNVLRACVMPPRAGQGPVKLPSLQRSASESAVPLERKRGF